MLIFVTGVAGSGKSSLCAELLDRGEDAHDADEGISGHYSRSGGEPVSPPSRAGQTAEWAAAHEYRFDLGRIRGLACSAPGRRTFILGAAYGDDEVVSIADRSFYLDVGEQELRSRLAARGPAGYGSAPHELDSIIAWHALASRRYEALGATRLDGEAPTTDIADALLRSTGDILRSGRP
jgi:hypothetical protein